jgi:hypothetical protein
MFNDRTVDVISRSSGIFLVGAFVLIGAAIGLGVSVHSPEHLLDFREWARVIGQRLRGL